MAGLELPVGVGELPRQAGRRDTTAASPSPRSIALVDALARRPGALPAQPPEHLHLGAGERPAAPSRPRAAATAAMLGRGRPDPAAAGRPAPGSTSEVSGPTGVKMNGPYDWVPPRLLVRGPRARRRLRLQHRDRPRPAAAAAREPQADDPARSPVADRRGVGLPLRPRRVQHARALRRRARPALRAVGVGRGVPAQGAGRQLRGDAADVRGVRGQPADVDRRHPVDATTRRLAGDLLAALRLLPAAQRRVLRRPRRLPAASPRLQLRTTARVWVVNDTPRAACAPSPRCGRSTSTRARCSRRAHAVEVAIDAGARRRSLSLADLAPLDARSGSSTCASPTASGARDRAQLLLAVDERGRARPGERACGS